LLQELQLLHLLQQLSFIPKLSDISCHT
jgi:hypothetical protein